MMVDFVITSATGERRRMDSENVSVKARSPSMALAGGTKMVGAGIGIRIMTPGEERPYTSCPTTFPRGRPFTLTPAPAGGPERRDVEVNQKPKRGKFRGARREDRSPPGRHYCEYRLVYVRGMVLVDRAYAGREI